MKKIIFLSLLVTLCVFSISSTYARDYIEVHGFEDDQVLSSMDITFISCVKGAEQITNGLVCRNTFNSLDLVTTKFNDTCWISYADLDEFDCVDVTLQTVYTKDGTTNKIAEDLHAKQVAIKPRRILETQSWDGGWQTASDTAYAIWILSEYSSRFSQQISDGMEWLKRNRDDATKCWSTDSFSESCSVYETSRSLGFLSFAGINDSFRIKTDGKIWLENRQNYIEDDSGWEIAIRPESNGNCSVYMDTSAIIEEELMNDSVRYTYDITPAYESLLNLTCSMDVRFSIYDSNQQNIFSYTFDEDDEYDYDYEITEEESQSTDRGSKRFRFNPPCWSATNKWQYCNLETTLYSLIPDIEQTQYDLAKEWFDDELETDVFIGKYVRTTQPFFHSSLYLYSVDDENEDVKDWLVYNQNNDGSWGTGDADERVIPTGMAVLALTSQTFTAKKEVLADAYAWFSTNTPLSGWSDTKKDALTFMVLKNNAIPFLKSYPAESIVVDSGEKKTTVINPTQYTIRNISMNLSASLRGKVSASLDLVNLSAYQNTTLTISSAVKDASTVRGIISFYNQSGYPLLYIPVQVITQPSIAITPQKSLALHNGSGSWSVNVDRANANFKCDITYDNLPEGMSGQKSFSTSKAQKVSLTFSSLPQRLSTSFSGSIVCTSGDITESKSFTVAVESYPDIPFAFITESRKVTKSGQNRSFTLQNNLNEPITVSLSITNGLFRMEESSIDVLPLERAKFVVLNEVPIGFNLTDEFTITATAYGYEDEATLFVDILYDPNALNWLWSLLKWSLLILFLGGLGYGIYYYRAHVIKYARLITAAIIPHIPDKIAKPLHIKKQGTKSKEDGGEKEESNPELDYYQDIVRIMRNLDKSESDIVTRLKDEGLNQADIDTILSSVHHTDEIEDKIHHEDKIKNLLDAVGDTEGDIFKKLRDQGYSEEQIKSTVSELESEIQEKEEALKKDLEGTK